MVIGVGISNETGPTSTLVGFTPITTIRITVNITPIEIPFLNNEIEYEDDDMFYLFSDGYTDQFGGDKGKKFSSRRFKHMLLDIYKKPLIIQKDIINLNLNKWMGNKNEQVDDIMIFGFKP